jgi:hypothetical protein
MSLKSLRILATDIQSVTIDILETATRLSCSICIDSYLYNETVSSPAAPTLQRTHPVSITKASNSECCCVQGDQKVSVYLITIQKVTSNIQSVPRQSPDI